jgi:Arginase/agmatinase/formimionoglutamate hydrolase, arginase family
VKEILVNAQWQGGGDLVTYEGAKEIIELYLDGVDFVNLPVSTDLSELAVKRNGIRGFDALRRQMQSAYEHLRKAAPEKIFTLGGGCDADVPGIVYLSEKYKGNLTIIWLDAHGDLNTPEGSSSSLYYGMPLRSVMEDHCFGLLENRFPLDTSQIIHIGGRDFDETEAAFIKESGISAYAFQDIRSDNELIHRIIGGIKKGYIYIHLDLDVIDPFDFPNTPLPVTGGLHCGEVFDILAAAAGKLAGFGIYEYSPCGRKNTFVEKLIHFGTVL